MKKPTSHEQRVQEELERLRSRNAGWRRAQYNVGRFFVRLFRIVAGLTLARVVVYLFAIASEKLDIPFGSMTIRDLATLLLSTAAALAFTVWAFWAAFGEAPDPETEMEADLRRQAEEVVSAVEQEEARRDDAAQTAADQTAWMFRRGKAAGLLFHSMRARLKR